MKLSKSELEKHHKEVVTLISLNQMSLSGHVQAFRIKLEFQKITTENFFGTASRQQFEVLQRNHNSLDVTKHSGEAEAEEHDEEEDSPERRNRHLDDGFCEHDEGQTCSLHALKENTPNISPVNPQQD